MTMEIPRQRGDTDLSPLQLEILAFEREWWTWAGAKSQALQTRFGLDRDAYEAALNEMLNHPAAAESDHVTVARLLRQRDPSRRD